MLDLKPKSVWRRDRIDTYLIGARSIGSKVIAVYASDKPHNFYDVVVLRRRKADSMGPERLRYPSPSDWGIFGWSYRSADRAISRFARTCVHFSDKHDEEAKPIPLDNVPDHVPARVVGALMGV